MKAIISTLASALCISLSASALAEDSWSFSIAPYVWLPSFDGDLNYTSKIPGEGSPNVSVGADDILSNLDLAAMFTLTARQGRWSVATDYIYLALSKSGDYVKSVDFNPGSDLINIATTDLSLGAKVELDGTVWTAGVGYALIDSADARMELLGGFRYLDIEASTKYELSADVAGPGAGGGLAVFSRSGQWVQSDDFWTGIIGLRGTAKLADSNWYAKYYADIGSGGSATTWQANLGIGYALSWGDVTLDYRYLNFDQDDGGLIQDMSFYGPSISAVFRF